MVRERLREKAHAKDETTRRCKTIIPLLKYFNTSYSVNSSAQGAHQNESQESSGSSSLLEAAASSTEEPSLPPAAGGVLPGTTPAVVETGAAAKETAPSSERGGPATAVVIATASRRRTQLCSSTLGLHVTSIPSTYEEDRKKSICATGERAGGAVAENEEAKTKEEAGGPPAVEDTVDRENPKRPKIAYDPQFSDEDLLALLADGSHRVRAHLAKCKTYALRMALGKASSIAQQLWDDKLQQQGPQSSENTNSSLEKSATTSEGDNVDRGNEKKNLPAGCIVIGADTIVELEGKTLEKAANGDEAKQMLMSMKGKTHKVHTAACIFTRKEGSRKPVAATVSTTTVSFADFTEDDVDAFVETGQYEGKAGSYGILEFAGQFIRSIDGCVFTVMGLPVHWISTTLASLYHSGKIA